MDKHNLHSEITAVEVHEENDKSDKWTQEKIKLLK